jgi:hypothetical protein
MGELELVASSARNQINLSSEYGWEFDSYEADLDLEHFTTTYSRLFLGARAELEHEAEDAEITGRIGLRHLLLYILDTELSVDDRLRPEVGLEFHLPLTQRVMLAGHAEWQADFGWVEELPAGNDAQWESDWNAVLEYVAGASVSLFGGYDSHYGWGAGLRLLF